MRHWFLVATFATSTTACGGDRSESGDGSASISVGTLPGTASDSDGVDSGSGNADSATGSTMKFDLGEGGQDSGSSGGEACESLDVMSDVGLQPADILVVVDNSGSMDFEEAAVQNYMNAFSSQIFLANVDPHVVLISSFDICLAMPLGSGGCPTMDTNPPLYTHIDQSVDSNNALQILLERHADWAPVMRQGASKHIIVVTDDQSDMSASDFASAWAALDPSYVPYKFHAIAATQDPVTSCLTGSSCCAISAAAGTVYMDLCQATGGVFGDLCDQEFQPIFDAVAMQVIQGSALACEYAIPEPPEGESFDPMKVNVTFDDGVGSLDIGYVDGAAACASVTDGWYYDDPTTPTTILLCPQTCDKIQGFTMAAISIGFGCATIPAG